MIYVTNSIDRAVDIREVIDFVRSDGPPEPDQALGRYHGRLHPHEAHRPAREQGECHRLGDRGRKDRDKMVDTVYINIKRIRWTRTS